MAFSWPKIAIIVLNWNGKQDTIACLESIEKLSYPNFEVIIIDNGSEDDSVCAIRAQFSSYILVENDNNLGFAEGNNIGIRKAMERGANMFFLLNNDTIVATDILERFVETYRAYPEAGILGAKIFLYDQKEVLDHLGGMWNYKTGIFEFIGLRQLDKSHQWQIPQELDYVCGAGLIIRRNVIEMIGGLDPRFFLIWEESDFCFRARRAGFKILTCPQAKIWHKVSASFVGKPHSTYFWWRNRLLWIEKNCSFYEKTSLYLRILIPDIFHLLKIQFIKKIQLSFIKLFKIEGDSTKREEKLIKNRAALRGISDYFMRRFFNGPHWLYKKTENTPKH